MPKILKNPQPITGPSIEEIIQKLERGSKEDAKLAKKEIENIRHGKYGPREKDLEKILKYAFQNFHNIEDDSNKAGFITALDLPILVYGLKNYAECKEFLLKILENPNGTIRQRAVYVIDYLCLSLRLWRKPKNTDREGVFIDLVSALFDLSKKHFKEARGRKYLNKLPPCVLRSVQLAIHNALRIDDTKKILSRRGMQVEPKAFYTFDFNDLDYEEVFDGYHDGLELHELVPIYSLIIKNKK